MRELSLIIPALVLLLCFSCSEADKKTTHQEKEYNQTLPAKNFDPEAPKEDSLQTKEVAPTAKDSSIDTHAEFLKKIAPYTSALSEQFDSLLYLCNTEKGFLFVVSNANSKLGIVDSVGNIILPLEFDKIYNPAGTLSHFYLEIEKDKKRGMVAIDGSAYFPPQFDVIYPTNSPNVYFRFKDGNRFGWVDDLLTPHYFDTETTNIPKPHYSELGTNWHFDKNDITLFLNPHIEYYHDDMNEASGIAFTPSYLLPLGILPEKQENIITPLEKWTWGMDKWGLKMVESKTLSEKVSSLVTSFYELGTEGRGHLNEQYRLTSLNAQNDTVDHVHLINMGTIYCTFNYQSSFRFINEGLIEVIETEQNPSIETYDFFPKYTYHLINPNGEITTIASQRHFPYTSIVKMDISYFSGEFGVFKEDHKNGEYIGTKHVSMEDLDLMRNEIFASHGYRFKSEKWKSYFEKQPWYEARFDDVNDQLSEIERHNIKLILEEKERMNGREEDFTKPYEMHFSCAG